MTDQPALPSSRRALLAGALGAAAASVAGAFSRPSPASAVATPVYLDQNNVPASAETSIETGSAGIANVFVGSHLGNGTGLQGYSGGGIGVYGWSAGGVGAGLSGNASAGSGANFGVWGQSSSTSGSAVGARAFAGSGATYGVQARSDSTSGVGVQGHAAAGSGATYGVYGQSDSTSGMGVFGNAIAGSGATVGVKGVAASSAGTGVHGVATTLGNFPTTGVHGQSDSPSGRGGYFSGGDLGIDAYASSSAATAGVRGTATGQFSTGVLGWAEGTSSWAVYGHNSASTGQTVGVRGQAGSPDGTGVVGYAAPATGATRGVVGHVISPDGTGVQGYSGTSETAPAPSAKTAVYGYATLGSGARGVYGRTTSGQGVRGQATTGTAGYFSTPVVTGLHTGTALQAVGRVKFDRCVGIATIANGATATAAISPGIDLATTSVVTATLMGSAGAASTVVGRVALNTTSNTFVIHLNAANTSGAAVKVGWHVFG